MVTLLLQLNSITMGKSNHFSGQPQDTKMDEATSNHRLHHHHAVLKPAFQGRRTTSQDRQKERWYQGAHSNPGQRGRAFGHKIYLGCHQRFLHAQYLG